MIAYNVLQLLMLREIMQYIQDYNFYLKKALIRVDFNVLLDTQFRILEDVKIQRVFPTLRKVLADGGSVILMSHLGRPQNRYEARLSLQHIVPYLSQWLGTRVLFAPACVGAATQEQARRLQPGEVLLLENIRFHPEETAGDPCFARALAALGDVYINDAFGTIHRAHVSTTQVAHYFTDKVAGYLMQQELQQADRVLTQVTRPFVALIGGAKITDKIKPIFRLLDQVDALLLGGGVAHTFHKALGGSVGASLVQEDAVGLALQCVEQATARQLSLQLPTDVIIAEQLAEQVPTASVPSHAVPVGWMALDIGPQTQAAFARVLEQARTILWSGPVGAYEVPCFRQGTQALATAIAQATAKGAFSLIGGGDSAAAIHSLGYQEKVSYISTGGGALLAYIAHHKDLPGIRALQ